MAQSAASSAAMDTAQKSAVEPSTSELHYTSLNAGASKGTILFIHGAGGDGKEWDMVSVHLQDYHILLPDLPSHGKSSHIRPLTLSSCAKLLADLIRNQAKDGKAHVIGLSLGAFIGIALAVQHPDVVDTMLISGLKIFPTSDRMLPVIPWVTWASGKVEDLVPRSIVRWAMDGIDIPAAGQSDFQRRREISVILSGRGDYNGESSSKGLDNEHIMWPEPWPARTLLVAAGKSGIVPSADHLGFTKKIADIAARKNSMTRAVTHKLMRHPWNRQDGPLFAKLVRAWIEKEEVVEGFEPIIET